MKRALLLILIFTAVLLAQTTHSVTLTWPPSAVDATHDAATSYGILRGTTPGGESTTPVATVTATAACTPVGAPTVCTYTDSTVSPGTYYYEFTATNSGGTSAPSAEVSVTVAAFPPNAPGKPTAVAH